MSHLLWYTTSMKNMKNNEITEAQLLLNQEVEVTDTRVRHYGKRGIVKGIMADGRTLDMEFPIAKGDRDSQRAFLDVTLVSEIQEPYNWGKQEQSLGPIANSVVKSTI